MDAETCPFYILHNYLVSNEMHNYHVSTAGTSYLINVKSKYFPHSKTCYITEKPYFCTVFFMVLDLRLIEDWLSG